MSPLEEGPSVLWPAARSRPRAVREASPASLLPESLQGGWGQPEHESRLGGSDPPPCSAWTRWTRRGVLKLPSPGPSSRGPGWSCESQEAGAESPSPRSPGTSSHEAPSASCSREAAVPGIRGRPLLGAILWPLPGIATLLPKPGARAKSLSRLTLTSGLQPPRLLCPWDSPGVNAAVGCHALLQESCPTPGLSPSL